MTPTEPTPASPGPRLGVRVFAAMGLVVVAGAATMILVSLLIAPAVFRWHLDTVGIQQTPEAAQHVQDGFALATVVATGVGVLAALAVAAGVAWFVARRIAQPITQVAQATTRLATGDYAARVDPQRLGPELADLTDSVNTLAGRLETTEQTRIRLMADLAHELRTPVASIAATVEAIADGVLPPDTETLDTLTGQSQRLTRLTDDLEAVSRAEERSFRVTLAAVDVSDVTRSATASAAARYTRAGVTLLTPHGPAGHVLADHDRLVEVLDQLLTNALHHCHPGDVVTLATRPSATTVELSVTDTGTGFDPADAEHLFQRFYRADPARTTQTGSGIGLTIARALVEAQHGTLTAHSPGPGAGSTFTIQLPRGTHRNPAMSQPPS